MMSLENPGYDLSAERLEITYANQEVEDLANEIGALGSSDLPCEIQVTGDAATAAKLQNRLIFTSSLSYLLIQGGPTISIVKTDEQLSELGLLIDRTPPSSVVVGAARKLADATCYPLPNLGASAEVDRNLTPDNWSYEASITFRYDDENEKLIAAQQLKLHAFSAGLNRFPFAAREVSSPLYAPSDSWATAQNRLGRPCSGLVEVLGFTGLLRELIQHKAAS